MTDEQALHSLTQKTILQQLIINKNRQKLTMQDISSIVIDLVMAGFDTTATMLHYVVYELGRHPEIQKKLYEEIRKHVNDSDQSEIDEEKLGKMQYLKLVVKEALRTHTLLPVIGRVLQEDLVLDAYRLPKGTSVSMCTITMCQSEKYFKNAYEFNPERWLTDANQIHPYASLPFGFGTRNCIGR
jgi:cytochrome P450